GRAVQGTAGRCILGRRPQDRSRHVGDPGSGAGRPRTPHLVGVTLRPAYRPSPVSTNSPTVRPLPASAKRSAARHVSLASLTYTRTCFASTLMRAWNHLSGSGTELTGPSNFPSRFLRSSCQVCPGHATYWTPRLLNSPSALKLNGRR